MTWIKLGMLAMILFFLLLIYFHLETKRFIKKSYQIYSDKIPSAFDGLNMMLLADLHNHEFGKDNIKLIRAIKKEDPDIIFLGGDMILARLGESTKEAEVFLKQLVKEFPDRVYYGMGNHEYRAKINKEKYGTLYADYLKGIESFGLVLLDNAKFQYKRKGQVIYLYFVEIEKEYYKRLKQPAMETAYLSQLLGKADKESYNILVAHNPLFFQTYAKWGADLVLSGHNHGGIVRIPLLGGLVSPSLFLFPKYDAGRFEYLNSVMLLSAGLGSHTLPFRVLNPPEIVTFQLHSSHTI